MCTEQRVAPGDVAALGPLVRQRGTRPPRGGTCMPARLPLAAARRGPRAAALRCPAGRRRLSLRRRTSRGRVRPVSPAGRPPGARAAAACSVIGSEPARPERRATSPGRTVSTAGVARRSSADAAPTRAPARCEQRPTARSGGRRRRRACFPAGLRPLSAACDRSTRRPLRSRRASSGAGASGQHLYQLLHSGRAA